MTDADPAPGESAAGSFRRFVAAWAPAVEDCLDRLLPAAGTEPRRLHEAMRYAMFPGGKRLRPMLALLGCEAGGGDLQRALPAACALEFLHTYSLVHDDLPCMDDDPMRRGRPSCHIAFDEATAVLAGDALLTLAFEAVAAGGAEAVRVLARAAGSQGMVGGQAADLQAEGSAEQAAGLERVRWIHDHKTGALITASLLVGAHAGGGCLDGLQALRGYGDAVGRAFQIADDCLDITGSAEQIGKQPGQDLAADKLTYPAVMGLAESRAAARDLVEEARQLAVAACSWQLPGLESSVARLQDAAEFMVRRGS